MAYNGFNEETVEIIKRINLLKTIPNDFVRLGYYVIRKDPLGISEYNFVREVEYRTELSVHIVLRKIMHLYPQIFYVDCGVTNIFFDWERIPLKTKERLRTAGNAGYVTMGYRRTHTNVVEEIPLGLNAGPALETLWYGQVLPPRRVSGVAVTSIRTPIHREQDNQDG